MKKFYSRPYRLFNKIQNYDWGTKNENAFIPKLLGNEVEPGVPYAELWIGTHPKAPSEIEYESVRINLNDLIEEFPVECLGRYAADKFSGKLPFLLKVLSAERALSIQTHPDKSQAKKLHSADPVNYPDDNHKPEIAIALDSLTAVAGFRPLNSIRENLDSLVELKDLVSLELLDRISAATQDEESRELFKELYRRMMEMSEEKEKLSECISTIRMRLKNKADLTAEENQFMEQYELFGDDIGLLSFFFFNMIKLKSGQAIFTEAGVPHAYIKGNIIECMANSDNVIRAGLTGKFKDVKTLLKIIKYEFKEYEIMDSFPEKEEAVYKTKAEEFQVSFFRKQSGGKKIIRTEDKPIVLLITRGSAEVQWKSEEKILMDKFEKGSSFFVPAALSEITVSPIGNVECYVAGIP